MRLAVAGLGRLGFRHAENVAFRLPGVELAAVCSLNPQELERAAQAFPTAARYADFDQMLRHDGLDGVVICTPSSLHVAQIEAALRAGLHVFSEKPLGVTAEECQHAERVVAEHPNQVFLLGFMRRFDPHYLYAKRLIEEGRIGKPFLVRSYSLDPIASLESVLRYIPHSGGLFLDMAVHDIDLANWYLGGSPVSAYAVGGSFSSPEFARYGDADNACLVLQYGGGEMAFIYAGRTAAHGYHIETEIVGTQGMLRVSSVPQKNLVQIFEGRGVLQECVGGFLERFEAAYLHELHEFVRCVRSGCQPEITVHDGTLATRVALAATASFKERRLVEL
ncbi:MAG: Gfo/Idh/MocA family oxidoreductase [Caldilineales bacterium]|nr:Gfo/Idh/MocA family oxidoreductase [Caldilineales bacterium]